VLIPAVSDQARQIHPLGMSVCAHERETDFRFLCKAIQIGLQKANLDILPNSISLMSDAANAIYNGHRHCFGGEEWTGKRGMCWFHCQQAFTPRLSSIQDEQKQEKIEADIYVLQVRINSYYIIIISKLKT
jgi:hypothetical protein